ncbi:MAG: DUF1540 domain-containing protein [Methylocystaceae bacterium]
MPQVSKCMCEECKYNHSYECHADGVEVRSMGDMQVESSEGTMCSTFAPRASSTTSSVPTRL